MVILNFSWAEEGDHRGRVKLKYKWIYKSDVPISNIQTYIIWQLWLINHKNNKIIEINKIVDNIDQAYQVYSTNCP